MNLAKSSDRVFNDVLPVVPFLRRVTDSHVLEIVPVLTLALVVFHGFGGWFFPSGVVLLAIVALLYPPFLRTPVFWFLMTCLAGLTIWHDWYPVDNHKYLLGYWCAVLFLTFLMKPEAREFVLLSNARFFLVIVMGLAVFQKLYSSNYVDGSFFEFVLLTDSRFQSFLNVFGVGSDVLAENRQRLADLRSSHLLLDRDHVLLASPPAVTVVTLLVTWWTVLIEAAIALAFVFCRATADLVGHVLLLVFIVSTYLVAPVFGFGFTLVILGYAICPPRWAEVRLAYIGCLFLLELYDLPWRAILSV